MKHLIAILISATLLGCTSSISTTVALNHTPKTYPNYENTTIPLNIAPLNFKIVERGDRFTAQFIVGNTSKFTITSGDGNIYIPIPKWRSMLNESKNDSCKIVITVQNSDTLTTYNPISYKISDQEIDKILVYRKIKPGYEKWNKIGIYQRDLTTYSEKPIVENTQTNNGCINCHTFCENSPEKMLLHFRKEFDGTVVYIDGKAVRLTTQTGSMIGSAVYPSWHPSGRYIAFSTNTTRQVFHASGKKPIEVYDIDSDIVIYDTQTSTMFTSPLLYNKSQLETFPTWSKDGKSLYFTSAEKQIEQQDNKLNPTEIRYNLYNIGFNEQTQEFSEKQLIIDAASIGKSISFPKSYDNNSYLSFAMSNYGNFSIWHDESDLYSLNLATGDYAPIEALNSDKSESYHSYSSNGNWIVFSSRRDDGLYTRPYFSLYNPEAKTFSTPFMLPANEPENYLKDEDSYNIPQLVTSEITANKEIIKAAKSTPRPIVAGKNL